MSPDIRDNSVPLLRSAAVTFRVGRAQDLGLELVDSIENGHPAFLDRLNAQPEIRAEFGVGFSDESRSKQFLLRRTQTEYRRLVTIECCGNGVRRG